MRPVHHAQFSPIADACGRFGKGSSSNLLITIWRELRDDQLAAIVVDKEALAVLHHKSRGPASLLLGDFKSLPNTAAGTKIQATELSITADTVNRFSNNHGRRNQ